MSFENILLKTADRIATITINRPKQLNALNKQTIQELHEALSTLKADDNVRVVIITGSGEKAFVAGADIKEFSNFSVDQGHELAAQGQKTLFDFIENFNKPVIAAVNGFALGGGLELAMACHIRIASENARMGLPETSLGLIPGYGGTQRLAQLIGKGRAMELIFTAEMIDAQRAFDMGLVNHKVTQAELLEKATEIAKKAIKNAPNAIGNAIKAVNAGYASDVNGYNIEMEQFGRCFGTDDFNEGVSAFLEKRKPSF